MARPRSVQCAHERAPGEQVRYVRALVHELAKLGRDLRNQRFGLLGTEGREDVDAGDEQLQLGVAAFALRHGKHALADEEAAQVRTAAEQRFEACAEIRFQAVAFGIPALVELHGLPPLRCPCKSPYAWGACLQNGGFLSRRAMPATRRKSGKKPRRTVAFLSAALRGEPPG